MMPFTGGQAHATRGLNFPVIGGATFARSFAKESRSDARAGAAVATVAARASRTIQDDFGIGGSPPAWSVRESSVSRAESSRGAWVQRRTVACRSGRPYHRGRGPCERVLDERGSGPPRGEPR